jgi:hypothetical protein
MQVYITDSRDYKIDSNIYTKKVVLKYNIYDILIRLCQIHQKTSEILQLLRMLTTVKLHL